MDYLSRFEKELKQISPYFRIVDRGFYAYIYWKLRPFEQIIPSLMKEHSFLFVEGSREIYVSGYRDTIFSMKKRFHSFVNNPASVRELKNKD